MTVESFLVMASLIKSCGGGGAVGTVTVSVVVVVLVLVVVGVVVEYVSVVIVVPVGDDCVWQPRMMRRKRLMVYTHR
jgi:hypothetical protein